MLRAMPYAEYIGKLGTALQRGDATEHTFRPTLKRLLEGLFEGVVATNEPKRESCGAPDFIVSQGQSTLGYIETKDIGVPLDEIEKAHPDVYNMLLQVMEEGQLTDSFGRVVDFKNVVLILTSNIGANIIKNQTGLGFVKKDAESRHEKMREMLMHEIEKHFKPEFLNRLDEIIVFKPLGKEDLYKIFDIEIQGVRNRLAEHEIEIEVPVPAKEWVLDTREVQNLEFGARPLRRAIERYIENPLSEELLRGRLEGKGKVEVRVKKLKDTDADGNKKTELEFVYTDRPKSKDKEDTKPEAVKAEK
jgi:ATP-dependent Clp protease ATP-binding subunit ClpC